MRVKLLKSLKLKTHLTPGEETPAITRLKINFLGRLLEKVAMTSEWHPNIFLTLSCQIGALESHMHPLPGQAYKFPRLQTLENIAETQRKCKELWRVVWAQPHGKSHRGVDIRVKLSH